MTALAFTSQIFLLSVLAGLLGALTGLGGGVVIIPVLTLLFGVDIRYAMGASLVSVIATSSGAAIAYVREGLSNIRIGMFLEIATTLGSDLRRLPHGKGIYPLDRDRVRRGVDLLRDGFFFRKARSGCRGVAQSSGIQARVGWNLCRSERTHAV